MPQQEEPKHFAFIATNPYQDFMAALERLDVTPNVAFRDHFYVVAIN